MSWLTIPSPREGKRPPICCMYGCMLCGACCVDAMSCRDGAETDCRKMGAVRENGRFIEKPPPIRMAAGLRVSDGKIAGSDDTLSHNPGPPVCVSVCVCARVSRFLALVWEMTWV